MTRKHSPAMDRLQPGRWIEPGQPPVQSLVEIEGHPVYRPGDPRLRARLAAVAPESGGVGAAAILSHNDFCTPAFLHPQPLTAKPHPGITTPPATLEVGHFNPVKTVATLTQNEANRLNSQHTIGPRCPRSGHRSQPEPISKSAAWPRDWVRSANPPRPPGPASEASPNPCQISRLARNWVRFVNSARAPLAPETGSFTPYVPTDRQHKVLQSPTKAPKQSTFGHTGRLVLMLQTVTERRWVCVAFSRIRDTSSARRLC